MTDIVNPSFDSDVSAFKLAGTIADTTDITSGYVKHASNSTVLATVSSISESALNAFAESHSSSSYDVTIDPGEAFIYGAWVARDTSTTVTLASSTTGQTVYVGWAYDQPDTPIIGLASAFNANDQKIPIWDFDTDGSGVTSSTDRRQLGRPTVADTHVDVSDDTSLVEDNVDDIDFGANIDVTKDGDNTVTVDAVNTDTRVNISQGGSLVEGNVGDIEFTSALPVTDNNDGTVTVDVTDTIGDSYILTTVTSDYTASDNEIVLADASGGALTVTLPGPESDVRSVVKKIDASNNVTVATPGSETIDGQSSLTLSSQYTSREITSDGTNYFII